jgi:hypothetical protein
MKHQEETDWNQVHLSNFESKAFCHTHWISIANDLIKSAKLLEPNIHAYWENLRAHNQNPSIALIPNHCSGPYFMLMGFAIENILKAGIVFRDSVELKSNFQNDRKFPKILKSHNLSELARKADIQLAIFEEDLLRRLTRHSVWAGRYPIPIDYLDMRPTEIFSDGEERLITWNAKQDALCIDNFISRLFYELSLMIEM